MLLNGWSAILIVLFLFLIFILNFGWCDIEELFLYNLCYCLIGLLCGFGLWFGFSLMLQNKLLFPETIIIETKQLYPIQNSSNENDDIYLKTNFSRYRFAIEGGYDSAMIENSHIIETNENPYVEIHTIKNKKWVDYFYMANTKTEYYFHIPPNSISMY